MILCYLQIIDFIVVCLQVSRKILPCLIQVVAIQWQALPSSDTEKVQRFAGHRLCRFGGREVNPFIHNVEK